MHKAVLCTLLSLAATCVAAQQQTSQPPKKDAQATPARKGGDQESDYEWRIRTEGAAGGTKPAPEREREGVGAGAKPHLHFDPLDRGLHRRSEAEVITPSR